MHGVTAFSIKRKKPFSSLALVGALSLKSVRGRGRRRVDEQALPLARKHTSGGGSGGVRWGGGVGKRGSTMITVVIELLQAL